jgi:bifunctional DNA-binding transcriptional regulator/antitoxin component of YhaV-PrlF toxin-antitoxin module
MFETMVVQIGKRGVVTLPQALREAYTLRPGDRLTLLDFDGVFVLSPQRSELDAAAERVTEALTAEGESLESVLVALREERERYASSV